MKKSDYRNFIIRNRSRGNDDFSSSRSDSLRYVACRKKKWIVPSVLVTAESASCLRATALESLGITDHRWRRLRTEEWIYVYGRRTASSDNSSPVLHLVQMVRDEAHRFAVTVHRTRATRIACVSWRASPAIGEKTPLSSASLRKFR